MLRISAVLFGIIFIFFGVASFIPAFNPSGFLFGFFLVQPLHGVLFVVSGVLGIMAATSFTYTKTYFQICGIVYLLLALAGFWQHNLVLLNVNLADNILHTAIGVIAFYLGWIHKKLS